jgi:predicted polyphosphate/ATP-dependent NAD kinase
MEQPPVGIIANPASGRDVRRLVAKASVFHTAEKCNMVQRALTALASCGVRSVVMTKDLGGIAAGVMRALEAHRIQASAPWPHVAFLEFPIEDSAQDSVRAVEHMLELGVALIMVLGGDGTHRVIASHCGSVPLVALSTGTNNVFPEIREATIAGLAAGLIATGAVPRELGTLRNKQLRVRMNGKVRDLALVDVCATSDHWTGARALWKPDDLTDLFVTTARADAIGLSAIAGLSFPVERAAPRGVRLRLCAAGRGMMTVRVPIAPGLIAPVGIAEACPMRAGEEHALHTERGVLALDGEREIEFGPGDRLSVSLELNGPLTVDIGRVMQLAAQRGLFTEGTAIPYPSVSLPRVGKEREGAIAIKPADTNH